MDTRLALLLAASGSLLLAVVYFISALRARRRAAGAHRTAVPEAVLLPPVTARVPGALSQLDAGDWAPMDEPGEKLLLDASLGEIEPGTVHGAETAPVADEEPLVPVMEEPPSNAWAAPEPNAVAGLVAAVVPDAADLEDIAARLEESPPASSPPHIPELEMREQSVSPAPPAASLGDARLEPADRIDAEPPFDEAALLAAYGTPEPATGAAPVVEGVADPLDEAIADLSGEPEPDAITEVAAPPAAVDSPTDRAAASAAAAAYFGLTLEAPPAAVEPDTDPPAVLLPRPEEATPARDPAAQASGQGPAESTPTAPVVTEPATPIDDQIARIMASVSEPVPIMDAVVSAPGSTVVEAIRAPMSETPPADPPEADVALPPAPVAFPVVATTAPVVSPAVAEHRLVAPVELHFGDSEQRVGIRPGTPTFLKYQRLAAVLLNDLKRVSGPPRD